MYVEMKDICKQYGSFKASDHVSFGIEKENWWHCLDHPAVERQHCFG